VLFLRGQLALYVERGVKPRRIDAATRVSFALLSRLFAWRSARVVVQEGLQFDDATVIPNLRSLVSSRQ